MKPGSVFINGGVGVGSYYENDYYNSPLGIKGAVEWGLFQAGPGVLSLGGELGGSFSGGGNVNYDHYRSQTIVIAARAAWHCGWQVRGLDTYGGVSGGLGFHHYQFDNNPNNFSHNSVIVVPGIFVGASYFITEFFGFNAEAGHDITDIQVGLVLRLKQ